MKHSYMTAAAISIAALMSTGAYAQEVDFSGKTIELIVPYGEGGGSSVHARLLAPLLEEELPGHPTIIIRNIEGGGSVRGINEFAARAKPDGLTIAALATGTYYSYILGEETVQYPLADFIPFLTSPYGVVSYGLTSFGLTGDPEHDVKYLQEHKAVYVGDGPADADMPVLYCFDLLGIELNGVFGVSRGESRQAFMRGESQVNYDNMASWDNELKPMVDDGTMVTLFTMGFQNENGEVVRDPVLPDTATCPELYEIVYGEPMSGVEKEVYENMFAIRMVTAKTLVLPAGTPDDIVQTYQAAIERVVARPELQSAAAQLELGGYPQGTGEVAIEGHRTASVMSPEAKAELDRWLKDVWNID